MKARKSNRIIYIVVCNCFDEPYFIDTVWTSEKKAEARKNELNSDKMKDWREDHGYLKFEVVIETVCK